MNSYTTYVIDIPVEKSFYAAQLAALSIAEALEQ